MADQQYLEREILVSTAGHSTVLATSTSSVQPYVLKKYILPRDYRYFYKQGIDVLVPFKHPHLISVESCFPIDQGICVVLEHMANGDLKSLIASKGPKKLEESFILRTLWQAMNALAELHSHLLKWVLPGAPSSQPLDHRFICTHNLHLTSDNTVKLSELVNLVLSTSIPALANDEKYIWYRAPEALNGQFSPAADIWSLGVVLYELCTYKVPYKGRNAQEVLQSIKDRRFRSISEDYSLDLREIIDEMMNFEANRRPKAEDLLQYQIFSPFQSIMRNKRVAKEEFVPKKWIPRLINWEEVKENRAILAQKQEEDYPFPIRSFSPAFPQSPRPQSSLRQFLASHLSPSVFQQAFSIVKTLFEGGLTAKYSSKPFQEPLETVLTKEEVVKFLPLLKVLCVRENKELAGMSRGSQQDIRPHQTLRRAFTASKLNTSALP